MAVAFRAISSRQAGCVLPAPPRPRRPRFLALTRAGGSVDSALAEADRLLGRVGGGGGGDGAATPGVRESADALSGAGFVCDESGCVLVFPGEADEAEAAPALKTLIGGRGWRLGMVAAPEDPALPALAGGATWTVPLPAAELADLLAVLAQLRGAVGALHAQGQWLPAAGDRPASRAKAQSRGITMLAAWAPGEQAPAFAIELSLPVERRVVTCTWEAAAVADLVSALDAATA